MNEYRRIVDALGTSPDVIEVNLEGRQSFFQRDIESANYQRFLNAAKLTDEEVNDLTPEEWYDFPEGVTL